MTVGTATSAMIGAHCGGHQLATSLGLGPSVAPAQLSAYELAHAHHLAPLGDTARTAATLVHADHTHMLPMASGAFLLGVMGALGALLALRRRSTPRAPRVAALLAIQLAGFAVLELSERIPSGVGLVDTLTDRRVLLGLLFQPVAAWLVFRLCRRTIAAVEALLAPLTPRVAGRPTVLWVPVERVLRPACLHTTTRAPRGPPIGRFVPT